MDLVYTMECCEELFERSDIKSTWNTILISGDLSKCVAFYFLHEDLCVGVDLLFFSGFSALLLSTFFLSITIFVSCLGR